jgi:hypothetical protein
MVIRFSGHQAACSFTARFDRLPSNNQRPESLRGERIGAAMSGAIVQLNVIAKRMLTLREAAQHCGRSPKRFQIECPAAAVIFPNGDQRFDVHDLDKWLDSLKVGADDADTIVSRLGHDRRAG